MNTREAIIRGLQIAQEVDPCGFPAAEHDIFMLGVDDDQLTDAQRSELKFLGFAKNDDYGHTA